MHIRSLKLSQPAQKQWPLADQIGQVLLVPDAEHAQSVRCWTPAMLS